MEVNYIAMFVSVSFFQSIRVIKIILCTTIVRTRLFSTSIWSELAIWFAGNQIKGVSEASVDGCSRCYRSKRSD